MPEFGILKETIDELGKRINQGEFPNSGSPKKEVGG
jgi:hypothetical protein